MDLKPPDLPTALPPFEGELTPKGSLREVEATACDFSGIEAPGVTVELCRLGRVVLVGSRLAGLRIWNSRIERGDWSGVLADEAYLERVEFRGVRMRGFMSGAAGFRNVSFVDCQLDSASFRFGTLSNVRFEGCSMKESDFSNSVMGHVEFKTCELAGATFERAAMKDVDLRTSSISELRSAEGLAGATISTLQLLDVAGKLASSFGVVVSDD